MWLSVHEKSGRTNNHEEIFRSNRNAMKECKEGAEICEKDGSA